MRIDYESCTYNLSGDGEMNAVLCQIDPFAYSTPAWMRESLNLHPLFELIANNWFACQARGRNDHD